MDFSAILGAVKTAADVVKRAAETPGINLLPYASTVASVIGVLQAAISAGEDVAPFVARIKKTFDTDELPSADDLSALDAEIAVLEAKIQAPLPPKEDGEPD
jgi:hypothetical protein